MVPAGHALPVSLVDDAVEDGTRQHLRHLTPPHRAKGTRHHYGRTSQQVGSSNHPSPCKNLRFYLGPVDAVLLGEGQCLGQGLNGAGDGEVAAQLHRVARTRVRPEVVHTTARGQENPPEE